MNPKKKSRRCLGLDSGLDLAISRFIYSFAAKASFSTNEPKVELPGPDLADLDKVLRW
jgi:hypothetical protein